MSFHFVYLVCVLNDVAVFAIELAVIGLAKPMHLKVVYEPDLSKALAVVEHLTLGRQSMIRMQNTHIKVGLDCFGDRVDRVGFAEALLLMGLAPTIE